MNRVFIMALVAGFMACAPTADREQPEEDPGAIYMRYAGMPEDRVRFATIRGWEAAGEQAVMIDFGARGHYLLELSPHCQPELRANPVMMLQNRTRNLLTRFDHVQLGRETCRITSIRPVDHDALRTEQERLGGPRGQRGVVLDQDSGGT
ncbi:MAG: DUF6491 family protein [Wenzhouxiangella sp.]